MKISKLFHWLYATLMFLPFVSVVSTSLYYAFNKNAVVPQVEQAVSKEVDFNQLRGDYNGNQVNIYGTGLIVESNLNGYLLYNGTNFSGGRTDYNPLFTPNNINLIAGHTYYFKYDNTNFTLIENTTGETLTSGIYTINFNVTNGRIGLNGRNTNTLVNYKFYLDIFDLTQMFGTGNEPTSTQFNQWYTKDYYKYTLSQHQVIGNYDVVEVADSPINHFWLPSFGYIGYNIESGMSYILYNIFGLNVINGIGYVINKLFTYWLIISICWLIFDVFMYVPNLVHKWLDKGAIE